MNLTAGELKMVEHARRDTEFVADVLKEPLERERVREARRKAAQLVATLTFLEGAVERAQAPSPQPSPPRGRGRRQVSYGI